MGRRKVRRHPAPKKCRTGKRRYRDKLDAAMALSSTQSPRARGDRREARSYKCPHCKGWHLTSRRWT